MPKTKLFFAVIHSNSNSYSNTNSNSNKYVNKTSFHCTRFQWTYSLAHWNRLDNLGFNTGLREVKITSDNRRSNNKT